MHFVITPNRCECRHTIDGGPSFGSETGALDADPALKVTGESGKLVIVWAPAVVGVVSKTNARGTMESVFILGRAFNEDCRLRCLA